MEKATLPKNASQTNIFSPYFFSFYRKDLPGRNFLFPFSVSKAKHNNYKLNFDRLTPK